jgi:DNA-binding Lrp family transcriptional regulator
VEQAGDREGVFEKGHRATERDGDPPRHRHLELYLKVRVKNTRMLEGLLAKVIKSVGGVERTETIIVLSSLNETSQIPTREPEWM